MEKKRIKKRPYIIAISALLSLILIGTAYAAANYQMNVKGYVNLNGGVQLEIYNPTIQNVRTGETIGYAPAHETTHDAISMYLYIGLPGEIRTIQFYVRNPGTFPSVVGAWNTSGLPDTADSGLEFHLPNLQGLVVPPGAVSGPYSFTVEWITDYYQVAGGTKNFVLSLGYHL